MQTTPPQIDPERPRNQQEPAPDSSDSEISTPETPQPGAPISVVPHEGTSRTVAAPVHIIRTNRYGHLEEHELIRLLDTIEDERAKGRFRESIYISLIVWLAVAWVLFYGPKYLWHAPQLITPADALHRQEVVRLNAPVLPHHIPAPAPAPKLDRSTIAKLRAMEPKPSTAPPVPIPTPAATVPTPAPVATQPVPPAPSPRLPLPSAPTPVARSAEPDAPTPQPSTRPTFNTPGTASDEMRDAVRNSSHSRTGGRGDSEAVPLPRGAKAGGDLEVLSDTQGVDFSDYLKHFHRDVMRNWLPLLPEEIYPPLSKQGETYILLTILPDGTIGDMKLEGSSHDDAINRSAWGSITSEGKFPQLPSKFHGPNLILRLHYVIGEDLQ